MVPIVRHQFAAAPPAFDYCLLKPCFALVRVIDSNDLDTDVGGALPHEFKKPEDCDSIIVLYLSVGDLLFTWWVMRLRWLIQNKKCWDRSIALSEQSMKGHMGENMTANPVVTTSHVLQTDATESGIGHHGQSAKIEARAAICVLQLKFFSILGHKF